MRRRAGVGAIQKNKLQLEKYKGKGTELQENQFEQLTKQMDALKVNLEEFATKHKHEIKKNPEFRRQFQEMCAAIGVDPLSSTKGFWSVLGIGDFYYELGVQIIEVCMATNHKNGGLISLDELRIRLIKARGSGKQHQEITNDDLLQAARKLKILGSGFAIVDAGCGNYMVHAVPGELSMDQTYILQNVDPSKGFTSVSILKSNLDWSEERSIKALNIMVQEGFAWIDLQSAEKEYYFPSLFTACMESVST